MLWHFETKEKVMTMLADVQTKLIEDGKASDAAHANYTKFCSHGQRDLGYDIKDGEKTVEELTARIAKASSEMEVSTSKLEELQGAVSKNEGDLKSAQDMREKEQKEHHVARKELEEATDMLGRAIKTLSKKVTPSLLQEKIDTNGLLEALGAVVDAAAFPEKESLMAFVENTHISGPRSEGIISTLEEMKMKARDELNTMVTEDKKSEHSFLMLKQSLEMQLSADQKEMEQAKLVKSEAQQEKAIAESDLEGSQKDLANDKESLKKLEMSCSQAAQDYEESKKHRAEEMEALKKAEDVLAQKTGAASSIYKSALLQIASPVYPLDDPKGFEVVRIMRSLAKKSDRMEVLAENVESLMQTAQQGDVFAKVQAMIENMIEAKKKEAAAEQTKKAYCEEEQSKTKAKLDELSSKKDSLGAKVDKKTSEAETLRSEAATLEKELAKLTQLQVEMDERRQEEAETFKKQKSDFQSGLEGVRTAISLLRDFYSSSGSTGASDGIVSMLEVVESDFGRSLAQAESVETSRAEEHDSMTKQNKLTKVQKAADQKFKSKTSSDLERAVLDLAADSETAKEELASVLTYQESLAKQCFDGGMSYEERKAQREEEIQGLKEALAALSTEVVFLQSKLRGTVKPHRAWQL